MEEGELVVDFEGREVAYGFGELDELVLAYATTIHKSQGSEYPAVVIPLTTQHYPMLPAQPALHRRDPGQAAGGAGRPAQGAGDRRTRPADPAPLVEAEGMAQGLTELKPASPIVRALSAMTRSVLLLKRVGATFRLMWLSPHQVRSIWGLLPGRRH